MPAARSCTSAVCLLLANFWVAPASAQDPQLKPTIVIVEGDGAINNIKDRINREPVIQVEDDNHKPIAGAAVVFFLPNQGPGGTFADGSRSLTVTTDAQGRAAARGIRLNHLSGQMQIRITATSAGQTATATLTQTNVAGSSSGAHGLSTTAKVWIVVGVVAAGAVAGGAYYFYSRVSSAAANSGIPTAISAGTPVVGAP